MSFLIEIYNTNDNDDDGPSERQYILYRKSTRDLSEKEKMRFVNIVNEKYILGITFPDISYQKDGNPPDNFPKNGEIWWIEDKKSNNELVAFVIINFNFVTVLTSLETGIYISDVYTAMNYRRKGFAEYIIKLIFEKWNEDMFLEVLINNEKAIKLYEKLKFIKIGQYEDKGYGVVALMKHAKSYESLYD